MKPYRVELDVYNGPLDLLLFLIRKEEMDIHDIEVSRITEQYVTYVRLLEQIDPNVAGDFLVMLATLVEIKSRMLLPTPPPEEEGEQEEFDPRRELIQQLLEYKRFKDASRTLDEFAREQSMRFPRSPADLPKTDAGEIDIEDAQIWDLMAAFRKLMEQTGRLNARHEVVYDDTPITLHAQDVIDRLQREGGSLAFEIIFIGRSRGEMIGLFLSLLELIRQKRVRADQEELFGQIVVHLIDATPITEISVLGISKTAEEAAHDEAAEAHADEQADTDEFDDALMDETDDDVGRRLAALKDDFDENAIGEAAAAPETDAKPATPRISLLEEEADDNDQSARSTE